MAGLASERQGRGGDWECETGGCEVDQGGESGGGEGEAAHDSL